MAFLVDKQELHEGLIIFRRSDVGHRNWYCRVKIPNADRYKTLSLKTSDINEAKKMAFREVVVIETRLADGTAIFNRPFREVGREYLLEQERRAKRGEVSPRRIRIIRNILEGALEDYVGSTQVHLIGEELWEGYPAWRRENGAGRNARNGVREVSDELAATLAAKEVATREKARTALAARGWRMSRLPKRNKKDAEAPEAQAEPERPKLIPFVSDTTIKLEISVFGAVMSYAVKKRYRPASDHFDNRPKLKIVRRDEFTLEEYRALHTSGRSWIKKATTSASAWYRTVTYNFILIMCNTGMRPSEAKNLRWRDLRPAKDREGREIVVLYVHGKGKERKLVAPKSVGDYFNRIREIAKAAGPDDPIFTTISGNPAKTLYSDMVEKLLKKSNLHLGSSGMQRSTYSFRHTYATFRLGEGVDVYFLAEQMGTSVKMIEDHYGHVNTVKHADRVLQGMGGWDPVETETDDAAAADATRIKQAQPKPAKGKRGKASKAAPAPA
jgi:integrase